ncbi:Cof-type HAD-IIB family hydrolase [Mycoplasmopsis primatum]|uniref:Cof-type HAD-IIB family hydrolase n=1 Tax=Mycoplasmopsis primatum TaxID=55604 RepID=UPI0004962F13|nr:HAD family hydrolase [Mycoplasmopsis primatum]
MKIKRIIFSDVDGTIHTYPDKKSMPDTKVDILNAVNNDNVKFVLNTGNPLLPKLISMAKELNSEYIICANGAAIYDVKNEHYIYESKFEPKTVVKIFDIIKNANQTSCFFGKLGYHLVTNDQKSAEFLTEFFEFSNWEDEKNQPKENIYKIEIYPDLKMKEWLVKQLKSLDDKIDLAVMEHHIEITPQNINKGTGALWLCSYLEADPAYCMSIGDSNNDLSMLSVIGFSYAMDNGSYDVKKTAKYYTSDVLQNGLGEAIKDYIFRTKIDILKQENIDKAQKRAIKEDKNQFYREKAKQEKSS